MKEAMKRKRQTPATSGYVDGLRDAYAAVAMSLIRAAAAAASDDDDDVGLEAKTGGHRRKARQRHPFLTVLTVVLFLYRIE